MTSPQVHRHRRRVQIYDTDASGLIFYGAPARWFADAEQELYDVLGIRMPLMDSSDREAAAAAGPSAPTRSFEVHIDRPLYFREEYDHEVWVSRAGRTSFALSHRISVDGEVRVRGTVNRVWVEVDERGVMLPALVPDMFRKAVVEYPPDDP
jgi:acyl-CoA thioesterase FadM